MSIGNDPTAGSPKGMVLFCGPAGGRKTLAADALAEALSLPIVRVDLSRTVSKYVGETEKNLPPSLPAPRSPARSKRTEVKDSYDRYANLEIAHLPRRIESHDGLVILASNQPAQPDDAFADERWRRLLHRIVRFPLPRR